MVSPRLALGLGALAALAMAVALFAQFSITHRLSRDESLFVYGGQQLSMGVPPYVSIVDTKTPLATAIAGGAVAMGRALAADDVYSVRLAFFVLACLAVVAVYLAGVAIFQSVTAGLTGAAVFTAFGGFAVDALGGPNPKTPAVLFAALATALAARRRWFWSGITASLASLIWQPLGVYLLVAFVGAWVASDKDERLRAVGAAVAGAGIPAIVTVLYFVVVGAFGELVENALVLPLTGIERRERGFVEHLGHVLEVVQTAFGPGALLLWAGLLSLVVLSSLRVYRARGDVAALFRDPLIALVIPPLILFVALSAVDFQGYDDAYPLLLYGALGVAGVGAAATPRLHQLSVHGRRVLSAAMVALLAATLAWYAQPGAEDGELLRQRTDAAVVDELLGPDGTLYTLGDPTLLVLTRRTNPSPNIFLSAGLDRWVVEHTPGGFDGWVGTIRASDPDMVQVNAWITTSELRDQMLAWLRTRYEAVRIGQLDLFVTQELLDRAGGSGQAELLR